MAECLRLCLRRSRMKKRSSIKGLFADSKDNTPAVRWLARALGIGLAVGIVAFGLFDTWAALIVNLIHGGSGPEPGVPGILGVLEWTAVFVGILSAFFWEGIGGAIVALVALAMMCMWAEVWQLGAHGAASDGPVVL